MHLNDGISRAVDRDRITFVGASLLPRPSQVTDNLSRACLIAWPQRPRQYGHLDVIKRWEDYTGKKAERAG